MSSQSASAVVQAPPETVWAMVADVTRMGEWSPECDSCTWIDGATGPEVGARFKGHNRRGWATWSTTCTVLECEPGRVFAFAVGGRPDAPDNVWRYSFVPAPDGTMVTETVEFPKPMGAAAKLVTLLTIRVRDREADLKRGIEKTLERLQVAGRAATL
ncbi:MAG: polyketide cyclase [Frankiales bacterium]|jgi:uncharacterized protein YndB with AHSA1/START domain|nr:polyketide cyclase [Frankiales bacterium]